jgi:hypothetical protein
MTTIPNPLTEKIKTKKKAEKRTSLSAKIKRV